MTVFFHKADRVVLTATTAVVVFSFVATLFMMVFISADVFSRWLLNRSINGCYEIVEVAMAVCVFASFAYTQAKGGHVHVTMVISRLPAKLRIALYAVTSLLTTVVIALVAVAAAKQSILSAAIHQVTGVLKLPYAAFYGVESFFMWVFFAVLLYGSVKNIVAIFSAPLAEEIQSHWT